MGTNRRYADSVDRQMGRRADEAATRGIPPDSLTDPELELDRQPLTRTPIPEQVTAWVRYGDIALKADAEAVAWTPRCIAIKWTLASGDVHRAWVWANAVERK